MKFSHPTTCAPSLFKMVTQASSVRNLNMAAWIDASRDDPDPRAWVFLDCSLTECSNSSGA